MSAFIETEEFTAAQHRRRLGVLVLALWTGPTGAERFSAQGMYPGDAAPEHVKLPYDFEALIRPRSFYKRTETLTGTQQQAWALGGFAGRRRPWLGDLVQFGVVCS